MDYYIKVNVFKGITKHTAFYMIVLLILVLQIVIITFGGFVFGVYPHYGLTIKQWLLSVTIYLFRLHSGLDR